MAVFGVLALVVGLLLIIVETHVPTIGIAGTVGALSVASGAALLLFSGGFGPSVALPVAAGAAVVGGGLAAVAGPKVLRARRAPVRSGPQSLIGTSGTVRSWRGTEGQIETAGGLWRARIEFGYDADPPLSAGERVVVERLHGLTLGVRRREPWEVEP
ncbi:serine protease [Rhodococcus sp. D2-41]|uniref:Serine protease n=1 Tax=Speluncibacter jeojiensis TaxID=2710754 RepID=A0A9X4LY56_9ACTN|nr:NfeD family protein [Rhodococcus sp. D2-41]MDG3012040.1 serine protease [Rhodococcus sp. D2-41]MDG3013495.1 serine protease [Corynebacteriales bacterium D3-21]